MPSLGELQQAFGDALLAADGRPPAAMFAGDGAARFAIYRRAVFANYHNALAATYPVVQRLLGAARFRGATAAFVRAHPSRSGDLNIYGDSFAAFLEEGAAALGLPCLPDVARLEWAIDEASRAADAAPAPDALLATLAAVPPEQLPEVRLRLAPSCRLLEFGRPVLALWNGGASGAALDGAAAGAIADATGDATTGATGDLHDDGAATTRATERLLVRRDAAGTVIVERIGTDDYAWLAALRDGRALAEAIDAARRADPAFELGAVLHAHVGNGTVAGMETP